MVEIHQRSQQHVFFMDFFRPRTMITVGIFLTFIISNIQQNNYPLTVMVERSFSPAAGADAPHTTTTTKCNEESTSSDAAAASRNSIHHPQSDKMASVDVLLVDVSHNQPQRTFTSTDNQLQQQHQHQHQQPQNKPYIPSRIESYFLDHGRELGLDNEETPASGCTAWKDPNSPIAPELAAFRSELKVYQEKILAFTTTKKNGTAAVISDLRHDILKHRDHTICDSLKLHPDGLRGIFPTNASLSQTSNGFLEPLFAPMRSPEICFVEQQEPADGGGGGGASSSGDGLLALDYLVHDFSAYCRKLKPTSRVVLFDMGASLDFHGSQQSPAIFLTQIYQSFGFHWDHIYAYEITKQDAADVFQNVPEELGHAYHWINAGVDSDKDSKMNPWNMLRREYTEDDFVVVKLDIDTPSVEVPLVQQLSESPELLKLVDVFYFEHHVLLSELAPAWGETMQGSILASMELFSDLRAHGVDAHYWV